MYTILKNHHSQSFTTSYRQLSLIGRRLIEPKDLSRKEIMSLLWTAIELKSSCSHNPPKIKEIENKLIFLISSRENLQHTSLAAASTFLNTRLYKMVKPTWDEHSNLIGKRRYLEANVDMIFCQSTFFKRIVKMSKGSKVPMVSLGSCRHVIPAVLADMMTIFEKVGKLDGINLTWVGKPCCYTNSYLWFSANLGVNVHLFCSSDPDKPMSPLVFNDVVTANSRKGSIKQHYICREATKGADVIVIHTAKGDGFRLTEKDVASASPNWFFMQQGLDGRAIDEKLCNRNLMWKSARNAKYIYAAMIVRFLTDYEHQTMMPNFEGDPDFDSDEVSECSQQ